MELIAQLAVREGLSVNDKSDPLSSEEDVENLVELMSIFECNNFPVTNELLDSLGNACVPLSGLANHSCLPNCVFTWENDQKTNALVQVCRCLREIRKGEELTHAYIDVAASRAARRTLLLQRYNFECACHACCPPSTDPCSPGRDYISDKISDIATNARTLERAVDACEWTAAESACSALCAAYRRAYQPYHPLLGLQFYTLGDIRTQLEVGNGSDAAARNGTLILGRQKEPRASASAAFKEAAAVLKVCFGASHRLTKNALASI